MSQCRKVITIDYICILDYKKCKFFKPNAELGASCLYARYSKLKHKILCENKNCIADVKQIYYTGSTDGYIPYKI